MIRTPGLSSALRRPWGTAGILLVSLLAIAAAVAGPALARAVEQSALADALAQAPLDGADLVVGDRTSDTHDLDQAMAAAAAAAGEASAYGVYDPPVVAVETAGGIPWRSAGTSTGTVRLLARSDGCALVVLTRGRCPAAAGEIAVPGAVLEGGVHLGERVVVGVSDEQAPLAWTVVAGYDPTRSAAVQGTSVNLLASTQVVTGPDWIATDDGLARQGTTFTVTARARVDPAGTRLDTEDDIRAGAAAVHQAANLQGASVTFTTQVPDLLDRVDGQRRAAAALITMVTVQLVALAVLGAAVVMQAVAASRAREWALGRLRGLSRWSWIRFVLAEPAVLLLVGGVAGYGSGIGFAAATARRMLGTGVVLEPWRPPVLVTAGGSAAALALALVSACARPARAPLAVVLRDEAEPDRRAWWPVAVTALLVTATAAGVYQLVAGATLTGPVSLIALAVPGLLAVTAGWLVVRVLHFSARRWTRRPAASVAGLLIFRRLARAPAALLPGIAVAAAVALVVFSTQLLALSERNRATRADAVVGADTVQRVQVPAGVDLRALVRAADPSGRAAMAAAELGNASGTGRLLAVDAERLAAVSTWRGRWAALADPAVAALLRPAGPAPIVLRGTRIRLVVSASSVAVAAPDADGDAAPGAVGLALTVDDGAAWQTVGFDLTSGAGPVTLTGALSCPRGCRVVHLTTTSSAGPYHATFTLSSMSTDRQPAGAFDSDLRTGSRWAPVSTSAAAGGAATATVYSSPAGLHLRLEDDQGYLAPGIAPGDVADPLPALIARDTVTSPAPGLADAVDGTGLDEQAQLLHVVGTGVVLPRVLGDGVLVDLGEATALSDPARAAGVQWEVWRTPGPHPELDRALTAAGVIVTGTDTLATAGRLEGRAATARAAAVAAALPGVGALLAVAVLLAVRLVARNGRRRVWAAGRWGGVSRARMTALALAETSLPAGIGVVVGAAAALGALLLAGDRLPLFPAGTVTPPLDTAPQWPVFGAVVAGAVLLVLLLGAVLAAGEAAGSRVRS